MADETTETTEHNETTESEATEGAETATEEHGTGEDTGTESESSEDNDADGDAYWQAEISKRDAEIAKYKELARTQERKYKAAAKGRSPETGNSRTSSTKQTAASGRQEDTGSTQESSSEDRLQQLADEIAQIKADQAEAARERTIGEVAKAKGLSVEQARRLTGDTREELEADADEVIALFGLDQTKKRTPGPAPKPKERKPQRGGSSNPESDDERSREDIVAAVTSNKRGRRK